MSLAITKNVLSQIAPKVNGIKLEKQNAIIKAMHAHLAQALLLSDITTPLRKAHFIAQIAHESDGFCTTEEYASGSAYEGRKDLGNRQKGDGKKYKGFGLIQITGRANYAAFNAWNKNNFYQHIKTPPDFLQHPELLAAFPAALHSAVWYWQTRSLNILADHDDLGAITYKINGGLNGLKSRRTYLERAKKHLVLDAEDRTVWA